MKSLPGWSLNIDETSNGVFRVTLTDLLGRIAEVHDIATDETIEKAKSYAFDIEKQTSKNWNKFLFDYCLQNLVDEKIILNKYDDEVFGSWLIELTDNRIVYDGKDSWLIRQVKTNKDWTDNTIIENNNLDYYKLNQFINKFKR